MRAFEEETIIAFAKDFKFFQVSDIKKQLFMALVSYMDIDEQKFDCF